VVIIAVVVVLIDGSEIEKFTPIPFILIFAEKASFEEVVTVVSTVPLLTCLKPGLPYL